jgi:molybdenum cofactor synthesis domain-containing protein
MHASFAAAVIIGNEVLSAKVEEQNGAHLVRRLRERGVPLRHLAIVPDEVDAIVEALLTARRAAAHVITSGGIGPTHDDVTVRSVALALGRRVVRSPEIEGALRARDPAPTPEALRLAEIPEGAELVFQEGLWYPAMVCERVYLLPGVPKLFRYQLEAVLPRIPGQPLHLATLYLSATEPEIARALDEVALSSPDVAIGSYPQFDAALDYKVKVTVEHPARARVEEILARLSAVLPEGAIVRRTSES